MPTNIGPEPVEEVLALRSATRRVMRSLSAAAARSVKVKATIGVRLDALLDQRGDAAGDRLGLAGPGTGDDLEVAAAVGDDLLLLSR